MYVYNKQFIIQYARCEHRSIAFHILLFTDVSVASATITRVSHKNKKKLHKTHKLIC